MTSSERETLGQARSASPGARIIDADALAAGHRVAAFDIGALSGKGGTKWLAPASIQAANQAALDEERQSRLRAQLEQAWRDGFDAGLREGNDALHAWQAGQAAEQAERFEAIASGYQTQLAGLEAELADRVVALAVMLARQTVRAAIDADPARVLPAVREALSALAEEQARPTVLLHPEDLDLVAAELGAVVARRGGQLLADPTLSRGDCRIDCASGSVDATLARRWSRALAGIGRDDPWQDTE